MRALGYKIVTKKLGAQSPGVLRDVASMEAIVGTLFHTHPIREDRPREDVGEFPLFNNEELRRAAQSLQNKKAPGPDGSPAEVLKITARVCPEMLLSMYNACLTEGVFSSRSKVAKLVLISKGKGDDNSPSLYRPLCMLDTAGKLFEKLI